MAEYITGMLGYTVGDLVPGFGATTPLPSGTEFTRTVTDTVGLSDDGLEGLGRDYLLSDTVVLSDELGLYKLNEQTISQTISLTQAASYTPLPSVVLDLEDIYGEGILVEHENATSTMLRANGYEAAMIVSSINCTVYFQVSDDYQTFARVDETTHNLVAGVPYQVPLTVLDYAAFKLEPVAAPADITIIVVVDESKPEGMV